MEQTTQTKEPTELPADLEAEIAVSQERISQFCAEVSALGEKHGLTCKEMWVGLTSVAAVAAVRDDTPPFTVQLILAQSYARARLIEDEQAARTSDSSTPNEAEGP
jgi:hypothetical protein